jgi:uncharacterized OB-fold protein
VSFAIPVCTACGAAAFPPRVLCARCGNREWRDAFVDGGAVERTTERDATDIASVRTPLGPLLVVRLLRAAAPGQAVVLDADGDVPVAAPGTSE